MLELDPLLWFRLIDVAAIVTNGLLGGAVARAHRFDIIGFIIFSVITAMGGGVIRDLMLDTGFPVALTDSYYWIAALSSAALAYTIDLGARWADRTLLVADFLGMGCWTATGTIKALSLGLHWLPSIALGVVTAVGGGVIRDVMVNRIPAILGGSPLYATVAFVGAAEVAVSVTYFDEPVLGMWLSIVSCLVMGLLARWRRWQLPAPAQIRLRVPRPRLLGKRRKGTRVPVAAQAWQPGEPITAQMQAIDAELIEQDRQRKGL